MNYIRLGKTGLKVSRICLGCMSYGVPERGGHPWSMPEDQSRPYFQRALEMGINFFDTANVYSDGTSEEITGGRSKSSPARRGGHRHQGAWPDAARRERGGPVAQGDLCRMDASLQRLGTDYVDLYQIHRFDKETPIEETLEALHDVVKAGKARYIGASSMYAWQFCKALYLADRHGWTRFVSMQNHYNLLYREEEREMMGLCQEEGVGVIPWSPSRGAA
jgi:aryl-alcohol dehydrogenase-like predicted oxidoreductase